MARLMLAGALASSVMTAVAAAQDAPLMKLLPRFMSSRCTFHKACFQSLICLEIGVSFMQT